MNGLDFYFIFFRFFSPQTKSRASRGIPDTMRRDIYRVIKRRDNFTSDKSVVGTLIGRFIRRPNRKRSKVVSIVHSNMRVYVIFILSVKKKKKTLSFFSQISYLLVYAIHISCITFYLIFIADVTKGHETKPKPIKIKKKKPMSKHKKKKQSFKDKLMPLLLIPFVIQTMLIPLFIMKLKLLTIKAMTVGKFAILLILFNMFRSWQRNAHSTSIRSTPGVIIKKKN